MFDIVVIAPKNDPMRKRMQEICLDFKYTCCDLKSVEDFSMEEHAIQSDFIVYSASEVYSNREVMQSTELIRSLTSRAFLVVVINGKMSQEDAVAIKRAGANLIILDLDAINSAKIDLIASQKIIYKHLPVKMHELRSETVASFDIYHLMPLNMKYLKIIRKGGIISLEKFQKLEPYGEIYIRKDDVIDFLKYVLENKDNSALGAASRCRAKMLGLTLAYVELILMILDQSEFTSYTLGKDLFEACQKMCSELLNGLSKVSDPWDIIYNTAIGDFGSIERGPSIAAYAGLLSLSTKIGDPTEVMVAALLMNVGLLDIEPNIIRKIRRNEIDKMTAGEKDDYEKHPVTSLHRILGRKLPITEGIKQGLLCSHENVDGSGFPNRLRQEKISLEAMVLKLAELIDQRSLIKMGQIRPNIKEVKESIIASELKTGQNFSSEFIDKLAPFLNMKQTG